MDSSEHQSEINLLADEIAAYLREHEQASDTLDGIVRWWLLRQRLQEGQRQVSQALELLCASGVVTTRKMPDGAVLFSSAMKYTTPNNAAVETNITDNQKGH